MSDMKMIVLCIFLMPVMLYLGRIFVNVVLLTLLVVMGAITFTIVWLVDVFRRRK